MFRINIYIYMYGGGFMNNWGWMMNGNVFPFRAFGLWWPLILLIIVLEVVLKGVGLYRSARNGQKYWFVAILIINTLGVLPLVYLI